MKLFLFTIEILFNFLSKKLQFFSGVKLFITFKRVLIPFKFQGFFCLFAQNYGSFCLFLKVMNLYIKTYIICNIIFGFPQFLWLISS